MAIIPFMRRLEHKMVPHETDDCQVATDPESGAEMTTIQVSKEVRDYIKNYHGRNYTERLIELDGTQNCSRADGSGGCRKKATNAKWFHAGEDLFVAMPLCYDCLEKCDIEHGERVFQ